MFKLGPIEKLRVTRRLDQIDDDVAGVYNKLTLMEKDILRRIDDNVTSLLEHIIMYIESRNGDKNGGN